MLARWAYVIGERLAWALSGPAARALWAIKPLRPRFARWAAEPFTEAQEERIEKWLQR